MSLLANSNAIESGGYNIDRSLRFRSSASAYLSRTPASAGNRQTWTWSGWVKRGTLGSTQTLFVNNGDASINIGSGDLLELNIRPSTTNYNIITTQVFRDPSAWYHIVCVCDTTNATADNRLRIYVNGIQVTSFGTRNNPALNMNGGINAAVQHNIGKYSAPSSFYFDGYLAEVNFIDGQALTPSSFGQTDAVTGVWTPKKYAGTYGTNGFYLPFNDPTSATTLAQDRSGNGNNWTPNNISTTAGATYDSMTDVPTLTSATAANYCVLNPLKTTTAPSAGNLNFTGTGTGYVDSIYGTFGVTGSGKYYFEAVGMITVGVNSSDINPSTNQSTGRIVYHRNNGAIYDSTTAIQSSLATASSTDIIGVALNLDAGTLAFYKNNVQLGTNVSISASSTWWPFVQTTSTDTAYANFGQRPFSYTPPTGFKALNTFNLPDPTIKKPNQYMDATLYTGNGSTQSVVNAGGFQPSLVWLKNRSNSGGYNHCIVDSVRGTGLRLRSNETVAELSTDSVTAFNSNGFSLGTYVEANNNGDTFVGWQWQAGKGTTSSNTSGDITSTVSVNASAGFSVITWTSDGAAAVKTVGHGLGVTPKFFITKNRDGSSYWFTYHQNLTSNNYYVHLESTDAQYNTGAAFFSQSSTTIGVRQSSLATNGQKCVAYCWAEIPGFSKFGSYTGNGSADGPFVYCGFRPKYVLVKRSDSAGPSWWVLDSVRSPYNVTNAELAADQSAAEISGDTPFDFVSNGFKCRSTWGGTNTSGGTYIYAAFAENPFKYSLAR